jgi:fumarate hydratase subunit alpha
MLTKSKLQKTAVEMLSRAATTLPKDVVRALKLCKANETHKIARLQFDTMLRNLELAKKLRAPICQDTGIAIFFVKLGFELDLNFDLCQALADATREATRKVPLRANIVDPLSRTNTGTNVGEGQPIVHLELVRGKELQLDLIIKGAGAENCSRLFMLKPTAGEEAIRRAVLLTIEEAAGQPCPPTIVGVGVGGSADIACLLAKRALLRPLDRKNPDKKLARMELELKNAANELGVGPMGLGGRTTVLGVHVMKSACHTASLPLAIDFQCWAARRASARLVGDELRVEAP